MFRFFLLTLVGFLALPSLKAQADLLRYIPEIPGAYGNPLNLSCMELGVNSSFCMVFARRSGSESGDILSTVTALQGSNPEAPFDNDYDYPYAEFRASPHVWSHHWDNVASAPSCVSRPSRGYTCYFVNHPDKRLQMTNFALFQSPQWSAPQPISSRTEGDPECLSRDGQGVDCFIRNSNFSVMHARSADGQTFSEWELLPDGGTLATGPRRGELNCLAVTSNQLHCFSRGEDGALWHIWGDTNRWSGWESLRGRMVGRPDCISTTQTQIHCFIRGTDNQLWHRHWTGSRWNSWENIDPLYGRARQFSMSGSPKCYVDLPMLHCFASATATSYFEGQLKSFSAVASWTWTGSRWKGWDTPISARFPGPPRSEESWFGPEDQGSDGPASYATECVNVQPLDRLVCTSLHGIFTNGFSTTGDGPWTLEARSDTEVRYAGSGVIRARGVRFERTQPCGLSAAPGNNEAQRAACLQELDLQTSVGRRISPTFEMRATYIGDGVGIEGPTSFLRKMHLRRTVAEDSFGGYHFRDEFRYGRLSYPELFSLLADEWRFEFPGLTCDVNLEPYRFVQVTVVASHRTGTCTLTDFRR